MSEHVDVAEQVKQSLKSLQQTGTAKAAPSTANIKTIAPSDRQDQKQAWYDLDGLAKYVDPLMVLGFVVLVCGVDCFSFPGAVILIGLGLMALSYYLGKV